MVESLKLFQAFLHFFRTLVGWQVVTVIVVVGLHVKVDVVSKEGFPTTDKAPLASS